VLVGILMIAAGVVTAKRAQASVGIVYLTITASDSQGGHFPTGTKVVQTATVTNSSESTFNNATPVVTVSYSTSAMNFLSNGPGWACTSQAAGQEVCNDLGTLTLNGTTSVPLTFSAIGNPADSASVTYNVSDAAGAANFDTFSQSLTATVSGSIDNAASYTKDAPAGAFGTKVDVDRVVLDATTNETFTWSDGPKVITLHVPAEAIPYGSHISLYVGDPAYWSSSFSSQSKDFVNGYAVAWTFENASTGTTAASLVTLVANDTNIRSGDHLYQATSSGIGPQSGIVGNGAWTVSFTADPGFVAGRVSAATATALIPGLPAAGQTQLAKTVAMPLVVAGILLVVVGTVAVGLRRRPG
jgi:hypothetical protein